MFAADDRKQFAENLLVPIIEDVLSRRKHVTAPTNEDMKNGLIEVLEAISDESKAQLV